MRKYTLGLTGALLALIVGCGQERRTLNWGGFEYAALPTGKLEEVRQEQDGKLLYKGYHKRNEATELFCRYSWLGLVPVAIWETFENSFREIPAYLGENGQFEWERKFEEAKKESERLGG